VSQRYEYFYWHCLLSVHLSDAHLSLCLSVPALAFSSKPAAEYLLLQAQPARDIDQLLHAAQHQ